MRDVAVIGVGMTHFGKYLNKSIKDLSREAVTETLKDAGLDKSMIEAAYVGNAGAGALTGQHMIRTRGVMDCPASPDLLRSVRWDGTGTP